MISTAIPYLESLHQPAGESSAGILEFISKNKHLKTIIIETIFARIKGADIFRVFEFQHLLMNLEEFTIDGIQTVLPAENLLRFLARNFCLKRISIIVTAVWYLYDVVDRIIMESDFYKTKIRNHTFEFTVKRMSDGTSMKFFIRNTKFPCSGSNCRIEYKDYFEFCSYQEPTIVAFNRRCPTKEIHDLWYKYANWIYDEWRP